MSNNTKGNHTFVGTIVEVPTLLYDSIYKAKLRCQYDGHRAEVFHVFIDKEVWNNSNIEPKTRVHGSFELVSKQVDGESRDIYTTLKITSVEPYKGVRDDRVLVRDQIGIVVKDVQSRNRPAKPIATTLVAFDDEYGDRHFVHVIGFKVSRHMLNGVNKGDKVKISGYLHLRNPYGYNKKEEGEAPGEVLTADVEVKDTLGVEDVDISQSTELIATQFERRGD